MKLFLVLLLATPFCYSADKSFPKGTTGGRFQLIQLSEYRRDQFLVDTQTGQTWSQACLSGASDDCAYAAFVKNDIEDVNISRNEMMKKMRENNAYLIEKAQKKSEIVPKE